MFQPGFKPPSDYHASDLWFVFRNGRLLIKDNDGRPDIPDGTVMSAGRLKPVDVQYLGRLDGRKCYAAADPEENGCPEPFQFTDLRGLFGRLDEALIWIAGRANHLLHWQRTHRFCGRCGVPTEDKPDERAVVCPRCGLVNYPRLSPAVIVAVTRNDRILLARNRRFRLPFYSVLAGFVEPGETLEACVEREIQEEVGLAVKDIRYFGSQPWPFPDSLMVGFTANWAAGEIAVDDVELVHADWFSREDLPRIPPSISIARQLIDAFARKR